MHYLVGTKATYDFLEMRGLRGDPNFLTKDHSSGTCNFKGLEKDHD